MKAWQERLAQLKRKWHELRFRRITSGVRKLPPIRLATEGPVVLSMVQHRDVDAYLLALGTFVRQIPVRRVVVVADPSLDDLDRAMLEQLVPGIEIVPCTRFQVSGLPTGGTWERLIAISGYVADGYVIQLDADTVATGQLAEVANCIRDNVAFTLGTEDRFVLQSLTEAAEFARSSLSPQSHVQVHAEAALDSLPSAEFAFYIRGCSGFAGFPQGYDFYSKLVTLSVAMQARLGKVWAQWGSEQFASNVMVANAPEAMVLPHPKYCAPHRRVDDSVFLHFIGYVRYIDGTYAALARNYLRTS